MIRTVAATRAHLIRRAATATMAALAVLTACESPPTTTTRVRAVMSAEPRSLSLIGMSDRSSRIVAQLITDSLVQYDGNLDLVPMLAESWEVSPDHLTVTFDLRPGVRWHDGTPFTATDVVFSVDKARDPATRATSFMAQFEDLVSVKAMGEYRVRAVYSKPYADFLEAWTLPIIPEHLAGEDDEILTGEFAHHPVGCGPFRFVRHVPDVELVLDANDDYWMGRPSIDGLTFVTLPDDRTAYQALLRGDVHLMGTPPDLWREAMRSEEAAGLERVVSERLMVWYIAWNLGEQDSLFDDPGVRRALVMALDREPFIEKVLAGLGRPAATTYHPDSPWANPDVRPLGFDRVAAGILLDDAGWIDRDADGVRDRNGRPLTFTLLTAQSRQEISRRIAAWVQQSFREIGVDMKIETLEFGAFLERRRAGQFDALMASMSFTPVADQYELYHSSARENGFNFFGFTDPEVDHLLESGRVTFDHESRVEIYHRLQDRLHETQPIAALFHFAWPVLHDPNLRGLEPAAIDFWRITPGPRAWSWSDSRP